ncbi:MAG: hypothetical protein JJ896_16705 [Rhodothermales bacterium]|nr:hypothetical protein [Rhodothermales bacterium]MBO6781299.1 hypothetical protein [Rhodothermales bacterium]
MFRFLPAFLVLACAMGSQAALGQASLFIPLDDPVYEDIRLAQTLGLLHELHPDRLPYTALEVRRAATGGDHPLVQAVLHALPRSASEAGTGYTGRMGLRAASHRRLDPARPLEDAELYPYLESGLHYLDGRLVARAAFRADAYWDRDPDGLDSVLRAFMRNDQSYVGLAGDRASLHLGRIATHWGLPGGSGLLVSENARSFDALQFRLGNDTWTLTSMLGELDSMTGDGRFTGTAGDDSVRTGSDRRWMSAHRLDWTPSPRFTLSILEAALFSGPNAGLSLKYLNPTQFLVLAVDNRPKNEENNALLGVMITARPDAWLLHAQLMVDDVDLFFGDEPASFAAAVVAEHRVRPRLVMRAHAEAVASRTYNTFQPEGRWLYLQRGIATQFSDYVQTRLGAEFSNAAFNLHIEPYLQGIWQGERDIRQPFRFDDTFATLLVGTVERSLRAAVRVRARRDRGYLILDAGFNRISNDRHISGALRTQPVITFGSGWRWNVGPAN